MRDEDGFSLCIASNTYSFTILLDGLTTVSVSEARVALVQQVTDQLGQEWLKGTVKEKNNNKE